MQDRLSVYTCVLFDESVDLNIQAARSSILPLLSKLGQVEEPEHAGPVEDEAVISNGILNRRHWAGVGILGAVNLCADQSDNHPFNTERMTRLKWKYFTPFLLALMQRLILHKLTDEANEVVLDPRRVTAQGIRALHEHFLNFLVNGCFEQITSREAVQQYYDICRHGLRIGPALSALQQAFADIDARAIQQSMHEQLSASAGSQSSMEQLLTRSKEMQESMDDHLQTVARVQTKLEFLEILILGAYGAEVGHLLTPAHAETNAKGLWYIIGWALGFIVTGVLIMQLMDRKHKGSNKDKKIKR